MRHTDTPVEKHLNVGPNNPCQWLPRTLTSKWPSFWCVWLLGPKSSQTIAIFL